MSGFGVSVNILEICNAAGTCRNLIISFMHCKSVERERSFWRVTLQ